MKPAGDSAGPPRWPSLARAFRSLRSHEQLSLHKGQPQFPQTKTWRERPPGEEEIPIQLRGPGGKDGRHGGLPSHVSQDSGPALGDQLDRRRSSGDVYREAKL